MSDIYLKNIILTTTILIQRSNTGFSISGLSNSEISTLTNMENYPLANELIQSIQNNDIYKFKTKEINYLSYIALISETNIKSITNTYSLRYSKDIKQLITNVANSLNSLYMTNDVKLYKDLTLHIYQMLMRLNTNIMVINPVLDEIKDKYARTYGVVWYFLNEFARKNHLKISDDEIAFITIHFQAAIERRQKNNKILFVCPHGIGTSSLALTQLKRILPLNSIIKTTSVADIFNTNLTDINFIISTISLPKLPVPVIKVAPLLTNKDLKNIIERYIDVNVNLQLKNKTNIDYNFAPLKKHILLSNSSNKISILNDLSILNIWANDSKRLNYLQSVQERENLQSTYLGNGIAIPHGDPKLISNSCVSIAILKKPIKWGNNKVDIVCLLMINDKDKKLLEPFMNSVMEGISDKDSFIKKMIGEKYGTNF